MEVEMCRILSMICAHGCQFSIILKRHVFAAYLGGVVPGNAGAQLAGEDRLKECGRAGHACDLANISKEVRYPRCRSCRRRMSMRGKQLELRTHPCPRV